MHIIHCGKVDINGQVIDELLEEKNSYDGSKTRTEVNTGRESALDLTLGSSICNVCIKKVR